MSFLNRSEEATVPSWPSAGHDDRRRRATLRSHAKDVANPDRVAQVCARDVRPETDDVTRRWRPPCKLAQRHVQISLSVVL